MISTHSFIFSFVSLHNDSDDFITSGKAYIDSKAYLTPPKYDRDVVTESQPIYNTLF